MQNNGAGFRCRPVVHIVMHDKDYVNFFQYATQLKTNYAYIPFFMKKNLRETHDRPSAAKP